ncbi:hypothetical protein DO73_3482 [Burkholderia pseudomallei]|nr:hypothetical protein DO73_3482 [Burkholderia pseudomallei]
MSANSLAFQRFRDSSQRPCRFLKSSIALCNWATSITIAACAGATAS